MVLAVRQGASIREVARRYCCGVATVHLWVRRVGDRPLSEINWNDRPSLPHSIQRTVRIIEDLVLNLRRELRESSVLGEYGAAAIHGSCLAEALAQYRLCVASAGLSNGAVLWIIAEGFASDPPW